MFYISVKGVLATRRYASGRWADPHETDMANLASFSVLPDSRSLSVSFLPDTNNTELLLYFEALSDSVSAFHGKRTIPDDPDIPEIYDASWTWQNLTDQLYSSSPNLKFGPPFFNSLLNFSDSRTLLPQAVFFDPDYPCAFSSVYFSQNKSFLTRM